MSIVCLFVLAIAIVPYSYGAPADCNLLRTNQTVIDEKGNELGNCLSKDSDKGEYFTYITKNSNFCCESPSARFDELCINYSLCETDYCWDCMDY